MVRFDKAVARTVQFAAVIAIVAVLAAVFFRGRETKRAFVPGVIQDTRVVADHGWETKWGSQLTWKAEYKVAYVVAGHEYTVWGDSGIRADSEADVRLALPPIRPPCQVRYDRAKPNLSVANCR